LMPFLHRRDAEFAEIFIDFPYGRLRALGVLCAFAVKKWFGVCINAIGETTLRGEPMKQKYNWQYLSIVPALLVLLAMVFGLAGAAPGNASPLSQSGPPKVSLDWPVDGEYPPEPLDVLAHAYDPAGNGIVAIKLFINGRQEAAGNVESVGYLVKGTQTWPAGGKKPEPGEYVVEVRAINSDGVSSEPSSARITIAEPEIEIKFTADQTTVRYGDCTTLRWEVKNAEKAQLDGGAVDMQGSRQVCPTEPSHTYSLTAVSPSGKTAQEVVDLTVPPTPKPPPGVEITFEADQSTFKTYGDPITLKWTVKHAQSVKLDGESVAAQGSKQVRPLNPVNTYTLTVVSLEGETFERKITVTVPATPTPVPQPIRINFTADQYTLPNMGSCTTLRWTVSNAQNVRLDGTPVASQGSQRVCPQSLTNNYRLTATASGGRSAEELVTITVTPQAQLSLTADQYTLQQGYCTTLRWQVQNVQAAYLNGGQFSNIPVSGIGAQQICPASTTTYVLTANLLGGGGDSRSVTVSVSAAPPPPQPPPPSGPVDIQFWADDNYINAGECTTVHWHVTGVKAYWVDGHPGAGDDGEKDVCPCSTETYILQVILRDGSEEDREVTVEVSGHCEEPPTECPPSECPGGG
jgi:uncharacterized Zn-binding protein involved in type VI secretion